MSKVKKFKKRVKKVNISNVENNSQNEIQKDTKNNNLKSGLDEFVISNSSVGVKKYREKLKKLGFKQVSIYLSPDVYEKLKVLKFYSNKSYADILERLIDKEFEKFKNKKGVNIVDNI